ncbi:hypothetical protein BDK51DRAFT_34106, partial [Blyttiomyces helicus]
YGIGEFPENAYVRLCYAVYTLRLQMSKTEPSKHINRALALDPAFDIVFQVGRGQILAEVSVYQRVAYCIDQLTNQSKEVDFLGSDWRLVHIRILKPHSWPEFQKLDGVAKFHHFKAMKLSHEMWSLLFQEPHRVEEIEGIAWAIEEASAIADKSYIRLINMFPKSKVLLRYYAQFCVDVTKELSKASVLTSRADRLEDIAEVEGSTASMNKFEDTPEESSETSLSRNSLRNTSTRTGRSSIGSGPPIVWAPDPFSTEEKHSEENLPYADDNDDSDDEETDLEAAEAQQNTRALTPAGLPQLPEKKESVKDQEWRVKLGKVPVGEVIENKNRDRGDGQIEQRGDDQTRLAMRLIDQQSSVGTTNPEQRQTQAMQQLRDLLLRANAPSIKMLMISSIIIGVIGFFCSVANYVVSTTLLQSTSDGVAFLYWLHIREYSTALSFRRCRQLQSAYLHSDVDLFQSLQSDLRGHMLNYRDASENLFAHRNMDDGVTNEYYTTRTILMNVSYYPEIAGRVGVLMSLQEVMNGFIESGLQLAALDFDAFEDIVQTNAYDYSMNDLYFNTQTATADTATIEVYCLSGLQMLVVVVLMILLDHRVRLFRTKQRSFLKVFLAIPRSILQDQVTQCEETSLEELFGGDLTSSPEASETNTGMRRRLNFRWQYGAYAVSGFVYLNVVGIYDLGQLFALLDQVTWQNIARMEVRREMMSPRDNLTWLTEEDLLIAVNHDLLYLDMTFGHVQYRHFNATINYTNDTVSLGIFTLSNQVLKVLKTLSAAIYIGPFVSDPGQFAFLEAVLEPDYVDGYHRAELEVLAETEDYLSSSNTRIKIIFIAEILVSQIFVFIGMVKHFRFQDNSTINLVVRNGEIETISGKELEEGDGKWKIETREDINFPDFARFGHYSLPNHILRAPRVAEVIKEEIYRSSVVGNPKEPKFKFFKFSFKKRRGSNLDQDNEAKDIEAGPSPEKDNVQRSARLSVTRVSKTEGKRESGESASARLRRRASIQADNIFKHLAAQDPTPVPDASEIRRRPSVLKAPTGDFPTAIASSKSVGWEDDS